jgi:RNA polymerase sigma-70 factor (ECF subfamily)
MTPADSRYAASPPRRALGSAGDQRVVVESLRAGDEACFSALVEELHASMMRVAYIYTGVVATAEDVVQETWLGLIESLDRFEGRCSLKTWIFRILHHTAQKRVGRDRRTMPFSSVINAQEADVASVDPGRFLGPGERWAGHWATVPESWNDIPEERFVGRETQSIIESSIANLPATQRVVIALRDVEGWESEEVCALLNISAGNQRALLHRARSKVRRDLEQYLSQS